ncbi:uncharacterized protein STEHIDRAFT_139515 [Stereum hirsutum FP-91666 SS1]|uniref:uncharacterized protein n=1 Tax=Stereum hirsutum (strain FP-91666) TaxID=721885 RepID=UPI000440E8CC|nr:uncharacterized protein STEHIDRAFT_139515 [Stereum hirsutum FP-91666 SS1]EIM86736.1 hypothetical protein STEHIDRAFT_139515 [Stereum hirsutum FP-91666 SS1]
MALESTSTIKVKLAIGLKDKASKYWAILQAFLSAQISRAEFDEQIRECVSTMQLVQLHNALIISIFDPSQRPVSLTPPPEAPKGPARKRKRLLPYQGDDPDEPVTLKSARLKRWALGLGKRERERVRNMQPVALSTKYEPRPETDEIASERGVQLLKERGDPAGSRPSVHLASAARGFISQHIIDRINLICAQHNLNTPTKNVSSLLIVAFEAKLKQLITQAITLTTTSHSVTSIHPSGPHSTGPRLSATSIDTLFTVSPAVLANPSAAIRKLSSGDPEQGTRTYAGDDVVMDEKRDPDNEAWQLLALLRDRSTVEQAIQSWT